MRRRTLTAILASMTMTACVPYPVYKTLQPSARVIVEDQNGQVVPHAQVMLISSAYPYGFEQSREAKESDSSGVAEFKAVREWRTEALVIHGSQIFFWNWCVRADGFETYLTGNRNAADFNDNAVIRLRQGKSEMCPTSERKKIAPPR